MTTQSWTVAQSREPFVVWTTELEKDCRSRGELGPGVDGGARELDYRQRKPTTGSCSVTRQCLH